MTLTTLTKKTLLPLIVLSAFSFNANAAIGDSFSFGFFCTNDAPELCSDSGATTLDMTVTDKAVDGVEFKLTAGADFEGYVDAFGFSDPTAPTLDWSDHSYAYSNLGIQYKSLDTTNSTFGPQGNDTDWASFDSDADAKKFQAADNGLGANEWFTLTVAYGASSWANILTAFDSDPSFQVGLHLISLDSINDGSNWALSGSPSPVPVPAAVWLFGSALLGLTGFSRRKKARPEAFVA